jgi:hypothetical protein
VAQLNQALGFAWSRCAKQFAAIRGVGNADIILIKDFR